MSLDIGGKTLLQKTVENAISSKAEYINVVLNKDYKFLEEDLKNISTNIIWNDDSNRGMSYSIALGIRNSQHRTENIMILLADQPGITPELINRLISQHMRKNFLITQPRYLDGPGHPVIFNKVLFDELLKVTGDKGGREIIKKFHDQRQLMDVDFNQPMDLDTKENYQKYIKNEVNVYEQQNRRLKNES
ncbi:nucleotidyltransferase family protein [Salinicoccus sp. Marseille-QA3877]